MPSLDDIARQQTSLDLLDLELLQRLVADWQIIADLCFGDLVLWLADSEMRGFWAAAQIRPTTAQTSLIEDVVATFLPAESAGSLSSVHENADYVETTRDERFGESIVRIQPHPIRRNGRTIGVIEQRTNVSSVRTLGHLESAYLDAVKDLFAMIRSGEFPIAGERSELADSLRVGDGFVRTNAEGLVTYVSPNALSAYRRMGLSADLMGADITSVTRELNGKRSTEPVALDFLDRDVEQAAELETGSATLLIRVIPIRRDGGRSGTITMLRDVTELRLRERELVSKEATIREIHHRVKNNLQTVAALLRLQSRRMESPEARTALDEAVQRVGSIAIVHETLSRSFDETVSFDEIADRLLRSVLDVSATSDQTHTSIVGNRFGSFGTLRGDVATPLAMVLTELVQNAVEHAFAEGTMNARVALRVNRSSGLLRMSVTDNGKGLPQGFEPGQSLGLSIVSSLVRTELDGALAFEQRPGGGTAVVIELKV